MSVLRWSAGVSRGRRNAPLARFAAIFHWAHERDNLTPRIAAGRWGISPHNLLTLTSSELGSCQTKSACGTTAEGSCLVRRVRLFCPSMWNPLTISNPHGRIHKEVGSFFFPLFSGRKGSLCVFVFNFFTVLYLAFKRPQTCNFITAEIRRAREAVPRGITKSLDNWRFNRNFPIFLILEGWWEVSEL